MPTFSPRFAQNALRIPRVDGSGRSAQRRAAVDGPRRERRGSSCAPDRCSENRRCAANGRARRGLLLGRAGRVRAPDRRAAGRRRLFGGARTTAHYELVGTGGTGHAESVEILYDPQLVSYGQILQVFFSVAHDPTQLNRQGPDSGSQYRSVIFYANATQQRIATQYIAQLNKAGVFRAPIVTRVDPFRASTRPRTITRISCCTIRATPISCSTTCPRFRISRSSCRRSTTANRPRSRRASAARPQDNRCYSRCSAFLGGALTIISPCILPVLPFVFARGVAHSRAVRCRCWRGWP